MKQRLVGASVLVALAVIVIPAWLEQDASAPAPVVQRNLALMPATEFPLTPASIDPLVVQEIQSGLEASAEDLASRLSESDRSEPVVPTDPEVNPAVTIEAAKAEEISVQPAPTADTTPDSRPDSSDNWVIQLGSFASRENAESLHTRLRKGGFEAFVAPLERRGKRSYRVRVGGASNRQDAERLHAELARELGYSGMVLNLETAVDR